MAEEKETPHMRFYAQERAYAKSIAPAPTLEYIEALEAIVEAAYHLWKVDTGIGASSGNMGARNTLYDTLAVVNFMDEEL